MIRPRHIAAELLAACALATIACGQPEAPPSSATPSAATGTSEGITVRVGGRDVIVHCAMTCDAARTDLSRLSAECMSNPTSAPHRVAVGGAVLALGCCEEASVAYERGCGHEGLPGCASRWLAECQAPTVGAPAMPQLSDDDRGATSGRSLGARGVSP